MDKTRALAAVKATKEQEKKLKAWLEARAVRSNPNPELATAPEGVAATRRARLGRRGLAVATISLRDLSTRSTAPIIRANTSTPKIRVVPASPSLCCSSTATSMLHRQTRCHPSSVRGGWDEGPAQLTAIRSRLYQSWRNGVKMVLIAVDPGIGEGFQGLEDVDGEDRSRNIYAILVLCLAGTVPNSVSMWMDAAMQQVALCGRTASRTL